jgi:hypothetical protein
MHTFLRAAHELSTLITVMLVGVFGLKHFFIGGGTLLNLGRITETKTLLRAIGQLVLAGACAWFCMYVMRNG